MEISIESILKKVAGLEPEGQQLYLKKNSNNCFPVKFVKFLRAPVFKEHLRTTACESKPLRCNVFLKAMANITSYGKVSFNYHLLFRYYPPFNSTIVRNVSPATVPITVLENDKDHYYVML